MGFSWIVQLFQHHTWKKSQKQVRSGLGSFWKNKLTCCHHLHSCSLMETKCSDLLLWSKVRAYSERSWTDARASDGCRHVWSIPSSIKVHFQSTTLESFISLLLSTRASTRCNFIFPIVAVPCIYIVSNVPWLGSMLHGVYFRPLNSTSCNFQTASVSYSSVSQVEQLERGICFFYWGIFATTACFLSINIQSNNNNNKPEMCHITGIINIVWDGCGPAAEAARHLNTPHLKQRPTPGLAL